MRLTLPDYQPGEMIPRADYAARDRHHKGNDACMVVGCDKTAAECREHNNDYRVPTANDAYERCKDKAIAYCWGRADAGDATAHPQEVWWAFSELWARSAFNFWMQERVSMHSIQRAWELFVEDKEI